MRDKYKSQRLGELPTAGVQTQTEKALSDFVMFHIREVERNRPLLLSIIVHGRRKYRQVLRKQWSWLKPPDELIDATFGYLQLLQQVSGLDPKVELEELVRLQRQTAAERVHGVH